MVPKPGGTPDEFYVFTNNAVITSNGTIAYHLVDLAGGGPGTITPSTTVGTWNSGEALGFFPHANGSDFWVLTFDTRATIRAYQVTATGVSATPVTSSTGLVGSAARGSIVHSPEGHAPGPGSVRVQRWRAGLDRNRATSIRVQVS